MPFLETLITESGIFFAEQAYHHLARGMRNTEFLCYEPHYLMDCYRDEESRIGSDFPYVELACFLGNSWQEFIDAVAHLRVAKISEPFALAKAPPPELSDFQAHALAKFLEEGRLDRDEAVVRLDGFDRDSNTLRIQKCAYSDGLRSNYSMDLKGYLKLGTSDLSLRALFQNHYGRKLPPLRDRRLSNAIGIAVVIFYRTEEGDIFPYLPMRAKPSYLSESIGTTRKQAVFSGGFHCTASGETMWKSGDASFKDIFTADICRELNEEVGIGEQDLAWIYPISLCREFPSRRKAPIVFRGIYKTAAART
jgi:hypothetical protein